MANKRLAFIIPTYNRSRNIAYYLNAQMPAFVERCIDVIIFDSSESNETKQVVQTYKYEHPEHAHYLFYDYYHGNKSDLRALDRKVYNACKKYVDTYEYLWLCGDGPLFQIEKLWDELSTAMQEKADCIAFHSILSKSFNAHYYESCKLFLKDYCWVLTLLGSAVFSSKNLKIMVDHYPVITGSDFWYWLPLAFFHMKAGKRIHAVVVSDKQPYVMNPYRTEPYWKQNGDVFWQWAKIWPEAIHQLPEYYDDIKDEVTKAPEKNMKLFSIKGLLGLKATNRLTVDSINTYKDYLNQVTNTPILVFYLIAVFGNQKVLSFIRTMYRKVKGAE